MNRQSASPCDTLAERYEALLEVAEAISAHRDHYELFRGLAKRLPVALNWKLPFRAVYHGMLHGSA